MPRGRPPKDPELHARKKQKLAESPFAKFLSSLEPLQDEDGTRQLVTAFVKLPSKKIYPDYYALISRPISLNEVHKKVARDAYTDPSELVADFRLMHENALNYNDPESWIVHDAAKLLEYVEEHASEIEVPVKKEAAPIGPAELAERCGALLDEVIEHEFAEEGQLSGPFMEDVSREDYPDYYAVIPHPTSFSAVKSHLEDGAYSDAEKTPSENLAAFHTATMLIFENAQAYNDPSSLIHEDAEKLKQVFETHFSTLKSELAAAGKLGDDHKGPVKLKLSLKGRSADETPGPADDEPQKKRRGRKPKKLIEEEQRLAALEAARIKEENGEVDDDEEGVHGDSENGDDDAEEELASERAMGKLKAAPSADDVFIRKVAFGSSNPVVQQLADSIAAQPPLALSKQQVLSHALYPEAPILHAATFFDYQFEPLGYTARSYSVTLPRDAPPIVNFKVALHELIYNIKKGDLKNGQGILKGKAEDEFMCSLLLNDEEIDNGCEMTEVSDVADSKTKLLNLTYELKLNYGLNMITFELRLSPSLSKSLKKKTVEEEPAELGGRHTRHQTQQIKLNWDVERFTLFVVSQGS